MADMSPICSIIVANASGTMVMMAVMASPVSNDSPNSENTVLSHATGSPTHGAAATVEKSTSPANAATAYDTITPSKMGTIFTMPLPQILHTTMTAIATTAMSQFDEAFVMAEEARISPMQMTMGPVTTGGKKRMTRAAPNTRNSADSTRYRRPAHATPRHA